MLSYPNLVPYSSYKLSKKSKLKETIFFNSGSSAFCLLVRYLEKLDKNNLFIFPAFTCPSMIRVAKSEGINFNFVDIDESLDIDCKDLESIIFSNKDKKIILISTSLFGLRLRNFKKIFPEIIVIEDLSQSKPFDSKVIDFQIYSFGRGKLISSWNGGALRYNSKYSKIKEFSKKLPISNDFLSSYLLNLSQKFISNYLWSITNLIFLLNMKILTGDNSEKIKDPRRMSLMKIRWVLQSIETSEKYLEHNSLISQLYIKNIPYKKQYKIETEFGFLRYPIKGIYKTPHSENCIDYSYTYNIAKDKRGVDFKFAKELLQNSTFLPTHILISKKIAFRIIKKINESNI